MKYESKTFGKVEWPWWHDAIIVVLALVVIVVVL